MTTLLENIQKEFNNLPQEFAAIKQTILNDNSLVTYMARHPLFEIEPFESLLRNELITEEERNLLFVQDEKEVNIPYEKLYTFISDPENQRIHHRVCYDENQNRHETVFTYEENSHKSLTLHVYGERILLHNVCHLFFKNGIPDLYLECTHRGVRSKKYRIENQRIVGFHATHTFFSSVSDVVFEYDASGAIDLIKEYRKGENPDRPEILFKRPEPGLTLETAFKAMEDFLVERITEEVLQRVSINEEVYFLMMEYCMPEAFPPELVIGVTSDLKAPFETLNINELYYPETIRHHSAEGTLQVDLYDEEMQYLFLLYYRAYNYMNYERKTFEYWDEKVKQVYLKVCQRLMHADFSGSFNRSEHFLVLAREGSNFDVDYFHERMSKYKDEQLP